MLVMPDHHKAKSSSAGSAPGEANMAALFGQFMGQQQQQQQQQSKNNKNDKTPFMVLTKLPVQSTPFAGIQPNQAQTQHQQSLIQDGIDWDKLLQPTPLHPNHGQQRYSSNPIGSDQPQSNFTQPAGAQLPVPTTNSLSAFSMMNVMIDQLHQAGSKQEHQPTSHQIFQQQLNQQQRKNDGQIKHTQAIQKPEQERPSSKKPTSMSDPTMALLQQLVRNAAAAATEQQSQNGRGGGGGGGLNASASHQSPQQPSHTSSAPTPAFVAPGGLITIGSTVAPVNHGVNGDNGNNNLSSLFDPISIKLQTWNPSPATNSYHTNYFDETSGAAKRKHSESTTESNKGSSRIAESQKENTTPPHQQNQVQALIHEREDEENSDDWLSDIAPTPLSEMMTMSLPLKEQEQGGQSSQPATSPFQSSQPAKSPLPSPTAAASSSAPSAAFSTASEITQSQQGSHASSYAVPAAFPEVGQSSRSHLQASSQTSSLGRNLYNPGDLSLQLQLLQQQAQVHHQLNPSAQGISQKMLPCAPQNQFNSKTLPFTTSPPQQPFILPSTMMPPSVLASVCGPGRSSSASSQPRKRRATQSPSTSGGHELNAAAKSKRSEAPQDFLDRIAEERGYGKRFRITADQAGYDSVPSPLQLASFGTELVKAVHTADVERLDCLLKSGLSPNPCNQFRDSIVDLVCKRASDKVFACLVKNGCDLRVCDGFGRTPLHHCCWAAEFCPSIARTILEHDWQQLFIADKRGQTPLEYVRCQEMAADWVQFLQTHQNELLPPVASSPSVISLKQARVDGRLADPCPALPIPLAAAVSAGQITTEQVAKMSQRERESYG